VIRRHNQRCLTCDWQDEICVEWFAHPPCPSCGGATERLWSAPAGRGHFVIGDDFIGGRTYHNLGNEPVTIQSRSELRAVLKARGLMEAVSHEGGIEGDRSTHTSRWIGVDLDGAKEMLERHATCPVRSQSADPDAPSDALMRAAQVAWEIESAKL
jgi:hypothetical protein